MNRALVDRIADAVLYEGYILYPYGPSLKNRQRWTFGGLFPSLYCQAQNNGDADCNQTECLIHGGPDTIFEAVIRFLHLTNRIVFAASGRREPDGGEMQSIESLRIGDKLYHCWQEAEKREVALDAMTLRKLAADARCISFAFPGGRRSETLRGTDGEIAGALVREQQTIEGEIELSAVEVAENLYRLTLRVRNRTPLADAACGSREEALLRSLASTHAILGVRQGEFVSLIDPPDEYREAAAACRNVGLWPVLVGEEDQKDMMLASPIILYDYPQIAPESPGEFFDSSEIDEMLTLRILTLTDDEKRAMAAVDERTRALLMRTETQAREQLLGLHGTIRVPHPAAREDAHG
jgi:hydrogenase maturation protease